MERKLRSFDDRLGNDRREFRGLGVKEVGEPIEIGECVLGPLDVYRPGHGWKRGVPQVSSQRTTRS